MKRDEIIEILKDEYSPSFIERLADRLTDPSSTPQAPRKISEKDLDKLSEKYSAEILPHEKKGSLGRCGLEVGFTDGYKAALKEFNT